MASAANAPVDASQLRFFDRIGIPHPLRWGFLGVLLFMIGVGMESNFLTPHLVERMGKPESSIALIITIYSLAVLIGSYLSGALSDLWGPRRVMMIGFAIWVVFHAGFLLTIDTKSLWLAGFMYFMRGFGMPLFSFSFLVWINRVAVTSKASTAIGWFYVMFTGGLPTLGSLVSVIAIPLLSGGHERLVGEGATLWFAYVLVALGGLSVFLGCRDKAGSEHIRHEQPAGRIISGGLRLAFSNRKVMQGFWVRMINTAPQFAMFVFMPWAINEHYQWGPSGWLIMTVVFGAGNIGFNAFWGAIGDKYGWVFTVRWFGITASMITLALWWYLPMWLPSGTNWAFYVVLVAGVLYGICLAGFVPLGAIITAHVPDKRGAAMAMYTTAAGGATFLGSGVVWIVQSVCGAFGMSQFNQDTVVVWTLVAMYGLAWIMVGNLRSDQDDPVKRAKIKEMDTQALAVVAANEQRTTIQTPVEEEQPRGH